MEQPAFGVKVTIKPEKEKGHKMKTSKFVIVTTAVLVLLFAVSCTDVANPLDGNSPAVPTDLSVNILSVTSVELTWKDNSPDNDGYTIERKQDDGLWSIIRQLGGNSFTTVDSGLAVNAVYYYRLYASKGDDVSGYSKVVTLPHLLPAPANLSINDVSATYVQFYWSDRSNNEEGFKIERKTNSAVWVEIAVLPLYSTMGRDTTVAPNTKYWYRVRAVTSAGESDCSNEDSTETILPAPDHLQANSSGKTTIQLNWYDNSSDETGFKVERKSSSEDWKEIANLPIDSTAYQDTALVRFSPYSYRVSAHYLTTTSDYSEEVTASPCYGQYLKLSGHSERVNSVAFNPVGTILASGSDDKSVKLWTLSDGKAFRTLNAGTGKVNSVAFSPDGLTVLAGGVNLARSARSIKLWRISDGVCLWTFNDVTVDEDEVMSVAFSPDGLTVATGGTNASIYLWSVADGECIRTFAGHTGTIRSVAFSPDGTMLASAGFDNSIKIWNTSDGSCIRTLTDHTDFVVSVVFSRDGSILASGSADKTIRLWRTSDGVCIKTLLSGFDYCRNIAFSPDGGTIISGYGSTTQIWSTATGECIGTLTGYNYSTNTVAFSPEGSSIAIGASSSIILWR